MRISAIAILVALFVVEPSQVVKTHRINLMSFAKFFFGKFDERLGIGNSLSVFPLLFK